MYDDLNGVLRYGCETGDAAPRAGSHNDLGGTSMTEDGNVTPPAGRLYIQDIITLASLTIHESSELVEDRWIWTFIGLLARFNSERQQNGQTC